MGADQEMLEAGTVESSARPRRPLLRMLRLVLGYVLAILAGSIIFGLLFPYAVPDALPPQTVAQWFDDTTSVIAATFVFGFVFGLPYTILGLFAFHKVLPRTMPAFLLVGTLCPSAAIVTMGLALGGITHWIDAEKLRIMIFTLPSGLAAAYLFGAVGLGYGFGRWRMNDNAS